jgi:nucleotide-binding universal stress UspA family protein
VLVLRGDQPIQRILITLDGSKLAERALLPGLELATRLGAEATLLRVYHPTQAESVQLEWTESGSEESRPKTLHSGAESYLNDLLGRCPPVGREIQTRVLYGGGVAHEILEYAAEHHTHLIAMSTHGRSGMQQWLYGSVTTKILHAFPGSMLIVRPAPTTQTAT